MKSLWAVCDTLNTVAHLIETPNRDPVLDMRPGVFTGQDLSSPGHSSLTLPFSLAFPETVSCKVRWVTINRYLEHIETQIDVDL